MGTATQPLPLPGRELTPYQWYTNYAEPACETAWAKIKAALYPTAPLALRLLMTARRYYFEGGLVGRREDWQVAAQVVQRARHFDPLLYNFGLKIRPYAAAVPFIEAQRLANAARARAY